MSARQRLVLDFIAFVALVVAANPAVTGIAWHEWISLVLIAPLIVHMVLNWDWVLRTIDGFFRRVRTASRFNLVIDSGLFVSAVGVTLSGVLVIPGFASSVGLEASPLWHIVHLATSDLTLVLLTIHLSLHARWILNVIRRMAAPRPRTVPLASRYSAPTIQLAPVPQDPAPPAMGSSSPRGA